VAGPAGAQPGIDASIAQRRPFAIFSSAGDEERRRRTADGVTVAVGALVVLLGVLQHDHPTEFGSSLTAVLVAIPDWVLTILGGGFCLAAVCALAVLLLSILARDRRGLVRDLLAAGAIAGLTAAVMRRAVEGA
jgi:hypothetical protein